VYIYEIAWIGIKDVSNPTPILYVDPSTGCGLFPSCPCVPTPNMHPDIRDRVESYAIHMIFARRLRITFKPKTKLIISKQRVPSSVLLLLREEALLLVFSPCYALCLGHFEFKTLLTLSSAFSKKPSFSVPDHPIGRTCGIGTSKLFFGTKKFSHSANLQATI
jgi:hypothetical protein